MASLSLHNRLERIEQEAARLEAERSPPGTLEFHFTEGWPANRDEPGFQGCEEHGEACGVFAYPSLARMRKLIIFHDAGRTSRWTELGCQIVCIPR